MSEEVKLTAQELKQHFLNRIDAARKEVEELSEEELESIAGGSRSVSTMAIGEETSSLSVVRSRFKHMPAASTAAIGEETSSPSVVRSRFRGSSRAPVE